MGIVYHGSKEHGIKRLEPRKSTHGVYVYATPEKVLALNFSGKCGDDLTYDIGHFNTDKNGPWEIVEKIPDGWKILEGATTAPKGYKWVYNGKSLFSGKREKALLKEL